MNIFRCALQVTNPPNPTRGGHPSHSNLVRGKLTSPTPNPAGDGTSGLTSYPRRRSKVSEATCLRPQRSAPSKTRTRAVRPRVQRSDHWATHASPTRTCNIQNMSRIYNTIGAPGEFFPLASVVKRQLIYYLHELICPTCKTP